MHDPDGWRRRNAATTRNVAAWVKSLNDALGRVFLERTEWLENP
jgi:hypothetical protein